MFEVGDVLSRNLLYTCLIDNGTMIIWKTFLLPETLMFSSSGIEHKTSGTKVWRSTSWSTPAKIQQLILLLILELVSINKMPFIVKFEEQSM